MVATHQASFGVMMAIRQGSGRGPLEGFMNKHSCSNQEYVNECADT